MDRTQLTDRTSVRALIIYLALWGLSTAYLAATGGDWIFPIASLVIFGLIPSTTSNRLRDRAHSRPSATDSGDKVAMVKAATWTGSVDQPSTPGPPRR